MVRIIVCAAVVLFSAWPHGPREKRIAPALASAAQDRYVSAAPMTPRICRASKHRVTSFYLSREFKDDRTWKPIRHRRRIERERRRTRRRRSSPPMSGFRDKKGVYINGLSCRQHEARCIAAIDCDGGSFNLKPSGQSLLLENQRLRGRRRLRASEDEQENEEYVGRAPTTRRSASIRKPFAACMASARQWPGFRQARQAAARPFQGERDPVFQPQL